MIIDIHAHVGRSWKGEEENIITIDDMIKIYDKCGIEKACINSWALAYDPPAGNNEVYQIVKKYPERFIGFGVISPRWKHNVADEVDRCINDLMMKGIKFHPDLNTWAADSPIVYPIMERIQEYKVPVLFHTWHDDLSHPSRVGKIAKLFPDVPILMGHMGGEAFYEAAFLAKELSNVYLDTTGFYNEFETLNKVLKITGKEKVIFGSDFPALNVYVEIAKINFSDISEDAKKAIFYENAKKLLKL